jgi:hypothetical protein
MTKVTFRCKRSGNTVSFTNPDDIKGMRVHESYTEVLDVETNKTVEVEPPKATTKEVLKLKRKAEVPSFLEE